MYARATYYLELRPRIGYFTYFTTSRHESMQGFFGEGTPYVTSSARLWRAISFISGSVVDPNFSRINREKKDGGPPGFMVSEGVWDLQITRTLVV